MRPTARTPRHAGFGVDGPIIDASSASASASVLVGRRPQRPSCWPSGPARRSPRGAERVALANRRRAERREHLVRHRPRAERDQDPPRTPRRRGACCGPRSRTRSAAARTRSAARGRCSAPPRSPRSWTRSSGSTTALRQRHGGLRIGRVLQQRRRAQPRPRVRARQLLHRRLEAGLREPVAGSRHVSATSSEMALVIAPSRLPECRPDAYACERPSASTVAQVAARVRSVDLRHLLGRAGRDDPCRPPRRPRARGR